MEMIETLKNIARHLKNISISLRILEAQGKIQDKSSDGCVQRFRSLYDFSNMDLEPDWRKKIRDGEKSNQGSQETCIPPM